MQQKEYLAQTVCIDTIITKTLHCRPVLESSPDRTTLTDYEARRLLHAIVKEFMQMTAEDMEQQAAEENRYEHHRIYLLESQSVE